MSADLYVSGSTEPWTVNLVIALQQALEPALTLELGTYLGVTTRQLALSAAQWGGRVVSVEADPERLAEAQLRCAELSNVEFVLSDTEQFLRTWRGEPFGFAFVDDDHSKQHVAAELELLHSWQGSSLMTPNGVICVHDVMGQFDLAPVVRAAHGYALNLPLLHAGGGLGVIQVPGPLFNSAGQAVKVVVR